MMCLSFFKSRSFWLLSQWRSCQLRKQSNPVRPSSAFVKYSYVVWPMKVDRIGLLHLRVDWIDLSFLGAKERFKMCHRCLCTWVECWIHRLHASIRLANLFPLSPYHFASHEHDDIKFHGSFNVMQEGFCIPSSVMVHFFSCICE